MCFCGFSFNLIVVEIVVKISNSKQNKSKVLFAIDDINEMI